MLFDQASGLFQVVLRAARAAVGVLAPGVVFLTEEQPGAVQVNVGQEQRHRAAFGDLPGFVEVSFGAIGADVLVLKAAQSSAGEETMRKIHGVTGVAQIDHDMVDIGLNALHAAKRVREHAVDHVFQHL